MARALQTTESMSIVHNHIVQLNEVFVWFGGLELRCNQSLHLTAWFSTSLAAYRLQFFGQKFQGFFDFTNRAH